MLASLIAPGLVAVALQAAPPVPPGEEPVAPYVQADANAGAAPFRDDHLWQTFGGAAGVRAIVDDLVARNVADPRIADIFRNRDIVRLRRTLYEQFCYLLNGGCSYSGQSMAQAHKDMGIQQADMAALVENLQAAMRRAHVPFAAQNRLLAKLAPMRRDIVTR